MKNLIRDIEAMRKNPSNVRFATLKRICDALFGESRNSGSSHFIYQTPWQGDPRINIQDKKGKAKSYQVKQVLAAIDRLERSDDE